MILSKRVQNIFKKANAAYYELHNKINTGFSKVYNTEINGLETDYKLLRDIRFLIDFLTLILHELENTESTKSVNDFPLSSYRDYFLCTHNYDIDPILYNIFHLNSVVPTPPSDIIPPSLTDDVINFYYGFSDEFLSDGDIFKTLKSSTTTDKTIAVNYNGNLGYIYFALPVTAMELKSILDPNSLEFIRAFNVVTKNNGIEDYYVYWLGKTKCIDDLYKFIRV